MRADRLIRVIFLVGVACWLVSCGGEGNSGATATATIDAPRYSAAQVEGVARSAAVWCAANQWVYQGRGLWAGCTRYTFDEATGLISGQSPPDTRPTCVPGARVRLFGDCRSTLLR